MSDKTNAQIREELTANIIDYISRNEKPNSAYTAELILFVILTICKHRKISEIKWRDDIYIPKEDVIHIMGTANIKVTFAEPPQYVFTADDCNKLVEEITSDLSSAINDLEDICRGIKYYKKEPQK